MSPRLQSAAPVDDADQLSSDIRTAKKPKGYRPVSKTLSQGSIMQVLGSIFRSIPKGLHNSAQGRSPPANYPGNDWPFSDLQPCRGCIHRMEPLQGSRSHRALNPG
jgi:hypothetical protein